VAHRDRPPAATPEAPAICGRQTGNTTNNKWPGLRTAADVKHAAARLHIRAQDQQRAGGNTARGEPLVRQRFFSDSSLSILAVDGPFICGSPGIVRRLLRYCKESWWGWVSYIARCPYRPFSSPPDSA